MRSSVQSEFKSNSNHMPREKQRNGWRFAPRLYVAAKAATHNANAMIATRFAQSV